MKVIIAGSRHFNNYKLLKQYCDTILQNQEDIEIVSGCAKGADALGEQYAKDRNYRLKKFPANWGEFGKAAGPMRNKQMAEYADALIAFKYPGSRGTANMIKQAEKYGLKIRVKHMS